MNKKQLLDHLRNDVYCRIGKSKIEGIGVVAVRDIPEGIDPFKKVPDFNLIPLSSEELKDLHPNVKKMVFDFFAMDHDRVLIPDIGLNAIDISFFMNHSEDSNIVLDSEENFISKSEIKEGEELVVDYSTFSDKLLFNKLK